MISIIKYKISDMAKNLEINIEDIFNILSKCNVILKKNKQTITPEEINILLEKITQDNQIDNLLKILNDNAKKKYKKYINEKENQYQQNERIINLINDNEIKKEEKNISKSKKCIDNANTDVNQKKISKKNNYLKINQDKITKILLKNPKDNILTLRETKFNHVITYVNKKKNNIKTKKYDIIQDQKNNIITRSPVVTVMGHVDHGKTSLLDTIRKSQIIKNEFGGITQHIGAYIINFNEKQITFLDTPGHEAFTLMRARGAKITDIVVLVVSIDDGIMPQTIEAINHAKDANVPIIVAINKIDKPHNDNDINNIIQQLANYDLVAEKWGGDVIICEVSAEKNIGIDNLLNMIMLLAEMLELKTNHNELASGSVIEASLDKNKGPIATLLVQNGILNIGDIIVAGSCYGKIKAMLDDNKNKINIAKPSMPVEILGLNSIPEAGDEFHVVDNEKIAKNLVKTKKIDQKNENNQNNPKITLDNLFEHIKDSKIVELKIIIKGDTQGSIEAISNTLNQLIYNNIKIKIIHCAVGNINESDIMLAKTSNAIIIGFNIKPNNNLTIDKIRDIKIKYYNIIYDCIKDIREIMKGLLVPELEEIIMGHAEVRQVFKLNNNIILGCYVLDGKITKNGYYKIIRNQIPIFEKDNISSLRRYKDDAKEVLSGYECGISLKKYNELKVGDILECSEFKEIKNSD